MEAQRLLFGFSSYSPPPSTQAYSNLLFPSLPNSSHRTSSLVQSRTRVSSKSPDFFSFETLPSEKRLRCRSSGEGTEAFSGGSKRGSERKKLAVFVSGGGSNFRAIHEATVSGAVQGDIVVVVTSKHDCGGATYARDNGIPVISYPKSKDRGNGLSSNDLVAALRSYEVDFILLAGYLKLIPPELVLTFQKSILNIHPSLLPAFGGKGLYGLKVHKAVVASGARYSGPTIHFVDENYDTGRILAQRVVPVLANDTAEELASRVLRQEHKMYVEVVAALCEDRVVWKEDGVPLIRSRANHDLYS